MFPVNAVIKFKKEEPASSSLMTKGHKMTVDKNLAIEDVKVQAELHKLVKLAEVTFYDIDREHDLYRGGSNHAVRYPYQRGEEAILATLRVKLGKDDPRIHPHKLWPRRYSKAGVRHSPSTLRKNYRRLEPVSPRQKEVES